MKSFIFVDDRETEIPIAVFKACGLDAQAVSPSDLSSLPAGIQGAYVFLIDLNLDDWDVTQRHSLTQPANGVDLASIVRSRFRMPADGAGANGAGANRLAAVCLYSGDLSLYQTYPPGAYRQHALARFLELEWVFEKIADEGTIQKQSAQLLELKAAVDWLLGHRDQIVGRPGIDRGHGRGSTRDLLADFLQLPAALPDTVREEIEASRPLIGESLVSSEGLSLVRWFLHRILPYPTFLIDEAQLALQCRLAPDAFRKAGLVRNFESARYAGVLQDYSGPRWWAHEVGQILWNETDGRPFDPAALGKAFKYVPDDRSGDLVLCIDENYAWNRDALTLMSDAVRVAPEDWPAFANPAWMTKTLVMSEAELREIVVEGDRELLD